MPSLKPYYQDDAVTIYHGDCLEILPELPKADLVLTDPPYGSGRHVDHKTRGEGAMLRGRHHYDEWDTFDCRWLARLLPSTPFAAFCSHKNLCTLIRASAATKVVYWRKSNPQPITPSSEPCVVRNLNIPAGSEWYGFNGDTGEHPTAKPLGLMTWLVSFAPIERIILDPFMGSGTTLRAAKDLGRKAIGIEIEELYCEIAAKRLAQEVLDFGERATCQPAKTASHLELLSLVKRI